MAKEKLKSPMTAFTRDGDFLAILYPTTGTIKIWNTGNGNLLAEWKQSGDDPVSYSCMACSFVGKKRKQGHSTFLLAVGTSGGDILAIDAFAGDMKWRSTAYHPGGVIGLAFANKGRSLRSIGTNGKASEMNSESGEVKMEFKASKKPISALTFSSDEEVLAVISRKASLVSLGKGKELLKFPDDLGSVQHISISKTAENIVTTGFGEQNLHVWRCNLSSKCVIAGPVLSMRHLPLVIECKSSGEENGVVVLAVSESGIAYVWNIETMSQDEVNPTKITVKGSKTETDQQKDEYSKKRRTSILAAQLHDIKDDRQLTLVIAYGSIDSPKFSTVNISNSVENIVVNDTEEIETVRENEILPVKDPNDLESEATLASTQKKKTKKKRAASEMDPSAPGDVDTENGEAMDGVLVEDDVNEPTMGEKLASLNLQDNDKTKDQEKPESPHHAKPPSADSVNILLKQALHAEDRALLLDCLYTQDEKVIANSISQLNPSDVLKLLHSLLTIIDSRGAILACALPWLKSLLLQHASGIISQDSSLVALNSLYQLIESRVSTLPSALQLSSCLDFLYTEVVEDISEENETIIPVIYEDKDESDEDEIDEQESEEAMETDQEGEEEEEAFGGLSDLEGDDDMSE